MLQREEAVVSRKRSSRIAVKESVKEEARLAAQRKAEEAEKMSRAKRAEARQQKEEADRIKRETAREQRRKEREAKEEEEAREAEEKERKEQEKEARVTRANQRMYVQSLNVSNLAHRPLGQTLHIIPDPLYPMGYRTSSYCYTILGPISVPPTVLLGVQEVRVHLQAMIGPLTVKFASVVE